MVDEVVGEDSRRGTSLHPGRNCQLEYALVRGAGTPKRYVEDRIDGAGQHAGERASYLYDVTTSVAAAGNICTEGRP